MENNKETKLILAPMAGATDLAFRKICRQFGATHTVTEMVSAKALTYRDKKSFTLLDSDGLDAPCSVQIFGHEPEVMAEGALIAYEYTGCSVIDINMGCPVHKIFASGDGSALMKSPGLIYDIVEAVKGKVPCEVTVKIRAGVDAAHANAVECALAAEEAGAGEIAVHGRFRSQMYAPSVHPEIIAAVKAAVKVPVIGNGDITDGASAAKMLEETGCDGLMIGRAALGNPFIFDEIACFLRGEQYIRPTLHQRIETARIHLEQAVAAKGEYVGCREARGTLAWYLKGIRGASALRARAVRVETLAEIYEILDAAERGDTDG